LKEHFHGHRKRLRERYLKNGIESLRDYEILELLLGFSIPVKDTKEQAKKLLKKFGNLKELFLNLDKKKFLEVSGVGEKSFILFKLVNDINKIIALERFLKKKVVNSIFDVVELSKTIMWNLHKEEFRVIFLNSKNEVLSFEKLSEGIINETYVYIRKIFERAFACNATALILIHNHPSGKSCPSEDDIAITKKIVKLSHELGITVHDHVIVARDEFYSFKENKLL